MKKAKYYMTFYEDIALLHTICNKQTLFFAEMVSRMDSDQVVQMTPYIREQICERVGVKGRKLDSARQYLHRLSEAGLIADIGKGAYMINPRLHGFNNIRSSIDKKTDLFLKIKYAKNGKRQSISCGSNEDKLIVDKDTGGIQ